MWEWRIFCREVAPGPWNTARAETEGLTNALKEAKVDKGRVDFYYKLEDAVFGLKERFEEDEIKIELKARIEVKGECESWEKISRLVGSDVDEATGLSMEEIKNDLAKELENPNDEYPISSEAKRVMEGFLEELGDVRPERFSVEKKRRQAKGFFNKDKELWEFYDIHERVEDPSFIVFEKTKVVVTGPDGLKRSSKTVCVEGDVVESIEKFVDAFILSGDWSLWGYPEFIMNQ